MTSRMRTLLIGIATVPALAVASTSISAARRTVADYRGKAGEAPLVCDPAMNALHAQTAWPRAHRDNRNSGYAPLAAPAVNRVRWTALDGAAVLAHPCIGPEGNIYVTTGQGPGTSHLHAFNREGVLLWESTAQASLSDVDSGAVANSALIDRDGDVYVSDVNQLWAFHPNGSVKWVIDLPDPDAPMLGAILTNDGFVGGITIKGKLVFVHREDGSLAVPIMELPGGNGPPGPPVASGLWAGGLVDPAIRDLAYHVSLGYEAEVANTPAIHPQTGRMFITAAGATPSDGVLYGIDLVEGEWRIAFATPMTGGSGTSPTLSPDGSKVFAVGGDKEMVALDTGTGKPLWKTAGAGSAAAPSVGPDGTVYSGGYDYLIAIAADDGSRKWSVNYDSLAEALLPRLWLVPSIFVSGFPVARTNGAVAISAGRVWIPLSLGYELSVPGSSSALLLQPRQSALMAVSPDDGHLISATLLRDSCEATPVIGADGSALVGHAAIRSSISYYQINAILPPRFDSPGAPLGGFSVLAPVSYVGHARSGILWVDVLTQHAEAALTEGKPAAALEALCQAREQLGATANTVEADTIYELQDAVVVPTVEALDTVRAYLEAAHAKVESDPVAAGAAVAGARALLPTALSSLDVGRRVVIDIGPGNCGPALRRWPTRSDVLRVAILGVAGQGLPELRGVSDVALRRSDGFGGEVRPVPYRGKSFVQFADVAAPTVGEVCSCESTEPDGMVDMVFYFSAGEVVEVLQLRSLAEVIPVPLTLSSRLSDGTYFESVDCVRMGGRPAGLGSSRP